jgi:O-antigen/teichoic acid export membrane protein
MGGAPGQTSEVSQKLRRFLKAFVWLVGTKGIAMAAMLGVNMLLARVLDRQDMGIFVLAASLSASLAILGSLGLGPAAVRYLPEARALAPAAVPRVLRGILLAGLVGCGALGVLLGLLPGPQLMRMVFPGGNGLSVVLGLIAVWTGLVGLRLILFGCYRGLGSIRRAAWLDGVIAAVATLAGMTALWLAGIELTVQRAVLISVLGVGLEVGLGLALLALWRRRLPGPLTPEPDQGRVGRLRDLLHVGLPLMTSAFVVQATLQVSLWILPAVHTLDEVALLGIAYRLMMIVLVVFALSNQAFAPDVSEMLARGQRRELEAVLRRIALLTTGACLAIALPFFFLREPILILLFGPEYVGAATPLLILMLAQVVQVSSGPAGLLLSMGGYHRFSLGIAAAGFVTVALLTLLLSPGFGAVGAAWATGIGIALRSLITVALAHRFFRITTIPFLPASASSRSVRELP